MKTDLKGLDTREMEAWAKGLGLEPYRCRQVFQWLYKKRATSFREMTDLPKEIRSLLEKEAEISPIEEARTQVSRDGTTKYLFRLRDGHFIESVLIPERDHDTLCLSSQVGCAMGCLFCITGRQGLKRNLRSDEIIEQAVRIKRSLDNPNRMTNVVFMGMGEPLANYHAVVKCLQVLISEEGMDFSHRRVTLSTCGLVPEMRMLGRDIAVNLAVSLNAADDETRSLLMPINRTYPLKSLLSACRDFPLPNRRRITFEYVLIQGINDRDEDARRLVRLLSGIQSKINLIPLNPHPDLEMSPSPRERILQFQEILIKNHFTAIIRKSKGQDISAACGQLSGEQGNA